MVRDCLNFYLFIYYFYLFIYLSI